MPQFDFDTISDVVLHLRYTAREGGLALRSAATAALTEKISAAATIGSTRLLSVRHEFPTEWARFVAATVDGANPYAPLTLTLREEHYPFWARRFALTLQEVELFASAGDNDVLVYDADTGEAPGSALKKDDTLGGLRVGMLAEPLPNAVGVVNLQLDDNLMSELWVALVWGGAAA